MSGGGCWSSGNAVPAPCIQPEVCVVLVAKDYLANVGESHNTGLKRRDCGRPAATRSRESAADAAHRAIEGHICLGDAHLSPRLKPGAWERLVKAPTERKGPPNRQPEANAFARDPEAMLQISELLIAQQIVRQITSSPVWISKEPLQGLRV